MLANRTSTRRLPIVALVIAATAPYCFAQSYSCRADIFMLDSYSKKPIVWSPDRAKHVQLFSTPFDDGNLSIYSGTTLLNTITLDDLSAGTFVKWASDSNAFYVMWSNGGFIGGYNVRAFIVEKDRAIESLAPKAAADDFAKNHYCQARGNNLYAIRWVNGSKELSLRPEVYPTGDCAPETALSADYLINTATGKIIQKGAVREMTPFADGCPSDIFPGAFTTQQQIDDYRKSHKP